MKQIIALLALFISLIIVFSIFNSCKKDEVKVLPTITTSLVSSITQRYSRWKYSLVMEVLPLSARGVVWGTATAPTTALFCEGYASKIANRTLGIVFSMERLTQFLYTIIKTNHPLVS